MLDKSVLEKSIVMKLSAEGRKPLFAPPDGFTVRSFTDGDEMYWADIEASVLEFPSRSYALAYFTADYLRPHKNDVYNRCVFIAKESSPVATATAWRISGQNIVHWVAVKPEFQNMGLGRAVLSAALSIYSRFSPDEDIYVHTRTWSHNAVCLYYSMGFKMVRNKTVFKNDGTLHKNEYSEAMKVLHDIIPSEIYDGLIKTAE